MDPFEVRMHFIELLKRLTASQQSIQRVISYAVKHFTACGEDFWECILENLDDSEKVSINARINILYFLDGLCERCLLIKSQQSSQRPPHRSSSSSSAVAAPQNSMGFYVDFVARDLSKIVECVVPEGRHGLPNLVSTKQILESWRIKRIIDPHRVDEALSILNERAQLPSASATSEEQPTPALSSIQHISKHDVFKRIEEDRERHKRLRERRWVQPISYASSLFNPNQMPLASFLPLTSTKSASGGQESEGGEADGEFPVDIEFENEWETTSDWNEDDEELVSEERDLCFVREGEEPMDLS